MECLVIIFSLFYSNFANAEFKVKLFGYIRSTTGGGLCRGRHFRIPGVQVQECRWSRVQCSPVQLVVSAGSGVQFLWVQLPQSAGSRVQFFIVHRKKVASLEPNKIVYLLGHKLFIKLIKLTKLKILKLT